VLCVVVSYKHALTLCKLHVHWLQQLDIYTCIYVEAFFKAFSVCILVMALLKDLSIKYRYRRKMNIYIFIIIINISKTLNQIYY